MNAMSFKSSKKTAEPNTLDMGQATSNNSGPFTMIYVGSANPSFLKEDIGSNSNNHTDQNILNNSKQNNKKERKDHMGNVIKKKAKNVHITFRDSVGGCNLADVKEVESYKEYNVLADNTTPPPPTGCSCCCVIL